MSEDDIRALIQSKITPAEEGDYFAVLDITREATKAEVQKSYFDLAKVLHPDKLGKHGVEDLKPQATKIFKVLSEAYTVLLDPERREKYVQTIKTPTQKAAEAVLKSNEELLDSSAEDLNVDSEEAAKIFSHKGALLLKKGDFGQAEGFYRKAHEADPENARYEMYLGWSMFSNQSNSLEIRVESSKQHLENAVKNDDENADAHYYMAKWYKEAGRMKECKQHLERAVALRRTYIEAKRELRLIEMRSKKGAATPKKASGSSEFSWPFGLDRFFKK